MNERPLVLVVILSSTLAAGAVAQSSAPATLTLRQVAADVLAHAPDVAAAEAAVRERQASARLAADELSGQAWLTTTPGYGVGLPTAVAGSVPSVVGVSWRATLYDRGARAEILARRAETYDAGAQAERAGVATVRSALAAYANCWADARLLETARLREEATQRALGQVIARHEEGRATDLDVEEARLPTARARLRVLDLESEGELDWLELRRLTGLTSTSPLPPLEDPLAALGGEPGGDDLATALAADPALRAAGESIALLARAAALQSPSSSPTIQAETQYWRLSSANHYDSYYRRFRADNWSVGVSVAIPLWTGGRQADAAARADAALERAREGRRARESALEIEVPRTAWAVARTRAGASLAREATGVADEALRVARARAGEGRGDAGDVERREIALADAQEARVRSELALFAARVDLLAVRGELLRLATGAHSEEKGQGSAAGPAPSPAKEVETVTFPPAG